MEDKLKEQEYERNRHFKTISKMFMNYIHQLHNILLTLDGQRHCEIQRKLSTKQLIVKIFAGNSRRNSPENVVINA